MTSRQTSIQNDIESLTVELNHQKRIRRNREEYNTLAKMINVAHPAVAKTREDLKIVQEEIDRTKLEVERAQWEISVKERQVRAFMASLGDLREVLRDEDWRKRRNEVLTKDDAADAGGVDTTQKDVESDGENKRMRLSDTEMDSDAAGAL
jgi:chromosome segregation ATPase